MFRTLAFALFFAFAAFAAAEEISLKDGTKIVGRMTAIKGDKIEVETSYGKMQVKRSDILNIAFPENESGDVPSAAPGKKDMPKIEESLDGTQYINKTGQFSLSIPLEWKINAALRMSPDVIAALSSRDDMRFLIVVEEQYTGSLESYKGLVELQAKGNLGQFEKLSESPLSIDGKQSVLLSYRGVSQKANNLPIQFLVAIIPSENSFYRLTTWCIEPLFNETQPTFEKIIRSYHRSAPSSAAPSSAVQPPKP